MKKFGIIALVTVIAAGLLGGGIYAYQRFIGKDMTGATYEEIQAYQTAHPHVTINYTVTIEGGSEPLVLDQSAETVRLETTAQVEDLCAKADYLKSLTSIDLGEIAFTADELNALSENFPNVVIQFHAVSILDTAYPLTTSELDLSAITADQIDAYIKGMEWLSDVHTVNLIGPDGNCTLTIADAMKLQEAYPHLHINYATTLFNQRVTTDMERLEYFKVHIGDAGLEKIREILPLMYNLNYLKLDWCGTSDEAMAQLRDEYADKGVKVVWRVFWSVFNSLTDNLKMWSIGGLMNKQIGAFKYMTDVRYVDFGHNYFSDLSFLQYMPNLEVAILAINHEIESLEELRNCKNLVYLEIFSTDATDLSPLADLKELRYLNISNMPVTDITPLYELDNLKYLWCTLNRNKIPVAQFEEFKKLHPDCKVFYYNEGDPTEFGWRKDPKTGELTPQYETIRQIFGYEKDDVSQYPKGYMTEPIPMP